MNIISKFFSIAFTFFSLLGSFQLHAMGLATTHTLILAKQFSKPPLLPVYQSYIEQPYWQAFQQFFPASYRLNEQNSPIEYFWQWRQHQIHVDHFPLSNAKAKLILVHGLSTHGRHMSMILGKPMANAGYEVFSLDLPLYGLTRTDAKKEVLYEDWVQMLNDFISQEARKDDLPIFLYGLSAGGMLAYHAASQNPYVKGVMGSSFLDLSRPEVREQTIRFYRLLDHLMPGLKLSGDTPIRHFRLPLTLVSKVRYTVNHPEAMNTLLLDPSSAGNRLSLGFFDSFIHYKPIPKQQKLNQPPLLLTLFENDSWTPSQVNHVFIRSLQPTNVHVENIPHAGHLPIEFEGLEHLHKTVINFIEQYR